MAEVFQASRQWERISELWVTEDAATDLTGFKSDRRNFNLALWDPTANGIRYLRALVYELATRLGDDDWSKIESVRNREVGDPVTVRYEGKSVCLDYLQAALELGFIEKEVDLDGAHVLEIGAGYGRTCHSMLSNYDLASYTIIDLKNTLSLSRAYLRAVLDEKQFAKLKFVQVEDIDTALGTDRFDLCVNVHSFTEMTPDTVKAYLRLIDERCGAFFVKNPVGKFRDKSMDGHQKGEEAVKLAMETGPLRQVLDIHDSEAVAAAVPAFIDAYRPADRWTCAADTRGLPWSYFWQAVFRNTGSRNTGSTKAGGEKAHDARP
ncbi:putative sugar O-methyltransferase [Streptomyces sp. NBS 14/10]|uniref:putative sugar O-methyltransferase n=1 Tax=Streptomyces sp. NBS 14/10 TaxID=1945643 RepID=UPI000B7F3A53|nr:putative sugar O-methyltransferase [Streptomyces sp. NBS 14/10]KAK1178073.1 putative sugar O-methyltransferase [Streptomyces sp. NBS 14/10]NUS86459.1 putative sugar O-methyltransferase [Streptomyces sp.]